MGWVFQIDSYKAPILSSIIIMLKRVETKKNLLGHQKLALQMPNSHLLFLLDLDSQLIIQINF